MAVLQLHIPFRMFGCKAQNARYLKPGGRMFHVDADDYAVFRLHAVNYIKTPAVLASLFVINEHIIRFL